jgi:hypothetical protein
MSYLLFGNVHRPVPGSGWTAEKLERHLTKNKGVRALAVRKYQPNEQYVVTGKDKDAYESLQAARAAAVRIEGSLSQIVGTAAGSGTLTPHNASQLKGLLSDVRKRLGTFQTDLHRQELDIFSQAKPYPAP